MNLEQRAAMSVIKKPNGTWTAKFRTNKIQKQKGGFKTKKEAQAYIDSRTTIGESWRDKIDSNFRTLTINNLCDTYMVHMEKTRSIKSSYIVDRVRGKFGETMICKLTPSDCRTWIDDLFDSYAIGSVKLHLTYFKAIINHSIKLEIINENPIASVSFSKVFRKAGVRNEILLPDDWPMFFSFFEHEKWYIKGIILSLWHTGMRISEILFLKWENVELQSATITLTSEQVKEGITRTIGIEPELYEYLKHLKSINNKKGSKSKSYVFGVTKDQNLTYETFYNTWKRVLRKTEYSEFLPHDMRHSYVTRKRREGHNQGLIKVQIGNSTNSIFDRYNSIQKDEVISLSGVNESKVAIIDEDVKKLTTKCNEHEISLSTLHSVIRKNNQK